MPRAVVVIGDKRRCPSCQQWKYSSDDFHKRQTRCIVCRKMQVDSQSEVERQRWRDYYSRTRNIKRQVPIHRASNLVANARARSKKTNMVCEVTTEHVHALFIVQNNKCAQTGIDFVFETIGAKRSLCAPSLDRRDSSLGYTFENTQLVCLFYNNAKNHGTDDEVWTLMRGAVSWKK